MSSLMLTRIESRRIGSGKSTLLLSSAVGHCILYPDHEVIMITPYPEECTLTLINEGRFPLNLTIYGERDFVSCRKHPGHSSRHCKKYFYDGVYCWDDILEILVQDSDYFGPYYATAVKN